jgi:hypothetical protein
MHLRGVLPPALVAVVLVLSACGQASPPAEPEPGPSEPTSPSPSATPSRTPTPTPTARVETVEVHCLSPGGTGQAVQLTIPRENPDFSKAWAAPSGGRCEMPYLDGARAEATPTTDLERAAYAASGYTGNDVGTLYAMCAAVRADDVVLAETHVMSAVQVAETQGMLTLCPQHPLAAQYLDAIDRATNPARQQEHPVYDGNYVVGSDLPAGTYRTTGTEWDACYWARVQGDGAIIENDFVTFAPDGITVTVHDGEGFQSQGCSPWEKVG